MTRFMSLLVALQLTFLSLLLSVPAELWMGSPF